MTVEIKDNNIVITLPLQKPEPSSSGKNLIVATTHGPQATPALVEGKPVTVGVNAYIKR